MKMFLISDNVDTLTGMRLVGVNGIVAHEREEVLSAIDAAYADKEIGIVLVTEKLSHDFSDIISKMKLANSTPLLIEIPDRHGSGRRKDFITAFVNESIGLKL